MNRKQPPTPHKHTTHNHQTLTVSYCMLASPLYLEIVTTPPYTPSNNTSKLKSQYMNGCDVQPRAPTRPPYIERTLMVMMGLKGWSVMDRGTVNSRFLLWCWRAETSADSSIRMSVADNFLKYHTYFASLGKCGFVLKISPSWHFTIIFDPH